jgi:hypothetical protein
MPAHDPLMSKKLPLIGPGRPTCGGCVRSGMDVQTLIVPASGPVPLSRRGGRNVVGESCARVALVSGSRSVFETPGRLASWAGVCPGSNESAGRIKSAHILPATNTAKPLWAPPRWPPPGAIRKLDSLGFEAPITPATAA